MERLGWGRTPARRNLGSTALTVGHRLRRRQGIVSVSMGEKGEEKEYRGRQITVSCDKLD